MELKESVIFLGGPAAGLCMQIPKGCDRITFPHLSNTIGICLVWQQYAYNRIKGTQWFFVEDKTLKTPLYCEVIRHFKKCL